MAYAMVIGGSACAHDVWLRPSDAAKAMPAVDIEHVRWPRLRRERAALAIQEIAKYL